MDEFEEYYKNSEWFGTYQSDLMMEEAFEAGQQSMQAKVCSLEEQVEYLQESANEMDVYIEKAQRCLPYFLLETKSDENWIGGVQNKIVELEEQVDDLQKRVDTALKIIESYTDRKPSEKYDIDTEIDTIYDVEQALKGEG